MSVYTILTIVNYAGFPTAINLWSALTFVVLFFRPISGSPLTPVPEALQRFENSSLNIQPLKKLNSLIKNRNIMSSASSGSPEARSRGDSEERIKLILFDLDGTLYYVPEFEAMYRESIILTYAKKFDVPIEIARVVMKKKSDELSKRGVVVSSNHLANEFRISWDEKEIGELKFLPFDKYIKPNLNLKRLPDFDT